MAEWVLRFFDLFAPLYRAAGVDRERFRALLRTRLVLDDRRSPAAGRGRGGGRSFAATLAVFVLCGAAAGSFLFRVDSPFTALCLVNGFVMVMVGLSLVADFTHVLVDTRENTVVLSRPVDDRTLFAARAAHVAAYLGLVSLSLGLFTLLAGTVKYHPLFLVIYPASLAAASVLTLFGVFLFFLALLRAADLERFRDVVLCFQVILTAAFFAACNLLPRLAGDGALRNLRLEDRGWVFLFPPAWTAAPAALLAGGGSPAMAWLTVLAAAAPVVCLLFLFRVLVPGFHRTLLQLEARPAARRAPPLLPPARLQGRDPAARAAFRWLWTVASGERGFKRALYPLAVLVSAAAVLFLLSRCGEGGEAAGLFPGKEYLAVLYFAGFLGPAAVARLPFGDRHEAAWIYHALPLERPGIVLAAGLRVVVLRFLLPLYLLVAAPVVPLWGAGTLPDILLAFCFLLCITAFHALFAGRTFPFSLARSMDVASSGVVGALLFAALVCGAGLVHYALARTAWGVWAAVPVLLLLAARAYRRYDRTSWWRYRRSRVYDGSRV